MPRKRTTTSAARATRDERSILICLIGLFVLTASFAMEFLALPYVKGGVPSFSILYSGFAVCVLCGLMSGYLKVSQLKAFMDYMKTFTPKVGS